MQLIVLGSGTAIPHPERGAAGYLVASGDTTLLLDCGSGTTQRLARARYRVEELDAVFLSHVHIDHVGDLPSLLFALRLTVGEDHPALVAHAGPGADEVIGALLEPFGRAVQPGGAPLHVETHPRGTFQVGELLCRVLPVNHHATSIGIRIESPTGATLAYLGDTGPCDAAIELCRGVDLAIVECSYPDSRETDNHLTPRTVADILLAAQPGYAVLTHLYPEAQRVDLVAALRSHGVETPVVVAYDGLGIELGQDRV